MKIPINYKLSMVLAFASCPFAYTMEQIASAKESQQEEQDISRVATLKELCAERLVLDKTRIEQVAGDPLVAEDLKDLLLKKMHDVHMVLFADIFHKISRQELFCIYNSLQCMAFSPDGSHAITCCAGGFNYVWDLTKNPAAEKRVTISPCDRVALSPGGRYVLAAESTSNTPLLYDLEQNPVVPIALVGHEQNITALAFSHDGRYALTGSEDCISNLWDIAQTPVIGTLGLRHASGINAIAFSPNGKYALIGLQNGAADLVNLRTDPISSTTFPMPNNPRNFHVEAVAFSPESTHALIMVNDVCRLLLDLRKDLPYVNKIGTHLDTKYTNGPLTAAAIGSFGKHSLISCKNALVLSTTDDKSEHNSLRLAVSQNTQHHQNGIAISADGKCALVATEHSKAHYYRFMDVASKLTLSQLALIVAAHKNKEKTAVLKAACKQMKNCNFWKEQDNMRVYELIYEDLRKNCPLFTLLSPLPQDVLKALIKYDFDNGNFLSKEKKNEKNYA